MKRVILSISNSLVKDAVKNALKQVGYLVQSVPSYKTDDVVNSCDAFFANLLLMDVNRVGSDINVRLETIDKVKKQNPKIKIALLCDNVSDPEIAYKIKQAKEEKIIDSFFYESVSMDYMIDILDSL